MTEEQLKVLKEVIAEFTRDVLVEKKRKKRSKKPGGPDTYLIHLKNIDHTAWQAKVSNAVKGAKGNVEDAAKTLDVSTRTMYNILDDNPTFQKIKDQFEDDESKK